MDSIRRLLTDHDADAVILNFLPDIRWACGFSGSNGLLIVTNDAAHFISDGRYTAQARREVRNATVHTPGYDLLGYIDDKGILDGLQSVVIQADHVTVDQLESWTKRFKHLDWKPRPGLLQKDVASKREDEITQIRAAQQITDAVFEEILSIVEPGLTEKDLAAQLVYQHLKRGADKMSFDPIVAAGANGSLPHARPSDNVIEQGDLVVIDMGCFKDGYASDMTRTIAVGEPGDKAREAYDAVLAAQDAAIEAARSRMTGKELDAVARKVLVESGYGEFFSHGLGHGVGLQVHEWPRLSYHVEHILPDNAAVTIEPGVYIPEEFGIRIEDIIVLSPDGCRNLTSAPKQLIVL